MQIRERIGKNPIPKTDNPFKKDKLKIYKISQTINNDYDVYRTAFVCAIDEYDAAMIHPNGHEMHDKQNWRYIKSGKITDDICDTWCHPLHVKVELIGTAAWNIKRGVVR